MTNSFGYMSWREKKILIKVYIIGKKKDFVNKAIRLCIHTLTGISNSQQIIL